jgi:hypothetical protein
MVSPDFTWRTKNFPWDELNLRKKEWYVKKKRPSMITDSNHVCFAKMATRCFQEVLSEISFSRFLKQVDGKNWRLHLLCRLSTQGTVILFLFHKPKRTISPACYSWSKATGFLSDG